MRNKSPIERLRSAIRRGDMRAMLEAYAECDQTDAERVMDEEIDSAPTGQEIGEIRDDLSTATIRLTKDLRDASERMGEQEARILVDIFETTQRDRIRQGNRISALAKAGEPNSVLVHFAAIQRTMEAQIGGALNRYVEKQPLGAWMMYQIGVGPLLAARLLAFVDWDAANTPSRVWAFAGLVPGLVWEKGQKRPWNARLKRVCFLLGESFVKTQTREGVFYGKHFHDRKAKHWVQNHSGKNRARALELAEGVGKTTDAHHWYIGYVTPAKAKIVAAGKWPVNIKPWEPLAECVIEGMKENRLRFLKLMERRSYLQLEEDLDKGKLSDPDTAAMRAALSLPEAERNALLKRAEGLAKRKKDGLGDPTGMPMLPPAHIHAMARRWTVKLFLAHAWERAFTANPDNDGKTWTPYAIEHLPEHGHSTIIACPPGPGE